MAMAVEYEGFEVRDVTVIEHGKTTWIPTTTVNNIKFIQLSKWNRDFVRFVGGKGLDFRNTQLNPANSEFFESLLAARKRASRQAVIDALAVDEEPEHADDTAAQDPLHRRARRNPKRTKTWSWASLCSSEALAHPFVTIKVQGRCMKVKTELRSNSLWVEFTKENMAFIQAGVQASGKGRCHKRKKGSAVPAIEAEDDNDGDGAGRETVDLKGAETLDE